MSSVYLIGLILALLLVSFIVSSYCYYLSFPAEKLKDYYSYNSHRSALVSRIGVNSSNYVNPESVPGHLLLLLLLHEDDLFFEHSGVNWREVFNRIKFYFTGTTKLAGGSSITQQLAKQFFPRFTRSWFRKYQQLLITLRIEGVLTKTEILGCYLSAVYLTHKRQGFKAASWTIFQKDLAKLNSAEALIILSFIPAAAYTSHKLISEADDSAFNYLTAFEKLREALRVLAANGEGYQVEDLERLTSQRALELMRNYAATNTGSLGEAIERRILMQSTITIHQVSSTIEKLPRPAPEFTDFSIYYIYMLEERIVIRVAGEQIMGAFTFKEDGDLQRCDWNLLYKLAAQQGLLLEVDEWLKQNKINARELPDLNEVPAITEFPNYVDLGLSDLLRLCRDSVAKKVRVLALIASKIHALEVALLPDFIEGSRTDGTLAAAQLSCALFWGKNSEVVTETIVGAKIRNQILKLARPLFQYDA